MPYPRNDSFLLQLQSSYEEAVNAYNDWCARIDELNAKKNLLDEYIDFLEEYKNDIHTNVYDELEFLPNCLNSEVEHTCQGQFIENLFSNCLCEDSPSYLKSMTDAYEEDIENTKNQAVACRDDIIQNLALFAGYRDEVSAEINRLASEINSAQESLRTTIQENVFSNPLLAAITDLII